MNLKKLANWMWKDTSNNLRLTPIFSILSLKIFIKKKIATLYKLKWLFCLQSEIRLKLSLIFLLYYKLNLEYCGIISCRIYYIGILY